VSGTHTGPEVVSTLWELLVFLAAGISSKIFYSAIARSRLHFHYTPLAVVSRARKDSTRKYGSFVERGRRDRQHAKRSSGSARTFYFNLTSVNLN
jgi:hypothetical protein